MVLEHALLPVVGGRETEFEEAFAEARSVIAATPGFRRLTLHRCLERPGTYLLLVEWDRLEDHMTGFRGSPGYERWRAMLHHFSEPFPVVEHCERVLGGNTLPTPRGRRRPGRPSVASCLCTSS